MSRATLTRLKSWRQWLSLRLQVKRTTREEYAWRAADAALVIIALAAMLLRSSILMVHLCQGLV